MSVRLVALAAGCVGSLIIAGIEGCLATDQEPLSTSETPPPPSSSSQCDRKKDPICTLTLISENTVPSVTIEGKNVPVSSWTPEQWTIYQNICPNLESQLASSFLPLNPVFNFSLPSGKGQNSTWGTRIKAITTREPIPNYVYDFNQQDLKDLEFAPLVSCRNFFWNALDSHRNQSWPLQETELLSIAGQVKERLHIKVSLGVDFLRPRALAIGPTQVVIPFQTHDKIILANYNPQTGKLDISNPAWQWEIPEGVKIFDLSLSVVDHMLLLTLYEDKEWTLPDGAKRNWPQVKAYFTFYIPHMQHEGTVVLPAEPLYENDDKTLEGTSFADPALKPYLLNEVTAVRVIGNEILVLSAPFLHHQLFYHLQHLDLRAQSGVFYVSRYSKFTGELIDHIRLPLREVVAMQELEGTRKLLFFGISNSKLEEDTSLWGTPTVSIFARDTWQMTSEQPLSTPVIVYYPRFYDRSFSGEFSKDGKRVSLQDSANSRYFNLVDGNFLFDRETHLKESPTVETWKYRYLEDPSAATLESRTLSSVSSNPSFEKDPTFSVSTGVNRDYLLIKRGAQKAALAFRLPIEESCYEFVVPFEGKLIKKYNCAMEIGAIHVAENQIWIGYGDRVFSAKLPASL